jgi:choline dehydrogenase-like flavoprotein
MKRAVVVGGGAGGAAAAKALQGLFDVVVYESGREFRPFKRSLGFADKLKRAGLLRDARQVGLFYPPMRTARTKDGLVLVWGRATGGTTTMTAGNALRMDGDLRALGVDLDAEFDELRAEIPISDGHRARWRGSTRRLFDVFSQAGLDPKPLPKMADTAKCTNCGRCVLGCPTGAKWDSRRFLDQARAKGAQVVTGTKVEKVVVPAGLASGVVVRRRGRRRFVAADLVILAAGGFGTPAVLERSGLAGEPRLSVDPVLCVAAPWPGARQDREVSMPFAAQLEGAILSPYFDLLSYFFDKKWPPGPGDIVSLMIKFADSSQGDVRGGRIRKSLTPADEDRMAKAVRVAEDLLARLGVPRGQSFLGTLNAGHPGGMLPLNAGSSGTLHDPRLPANVYVADATLLPGALGNPPSLTIMALARKVSRLAAEKFA